MFNTYRRIQHVQLHRTQTRELNMKKIVRGITNWFNNWVDDIVQVTFMPWDWQNTPKHRALNTWRNRVLDEAARRAV